MLSKKFWLSTLEWVGAITLGAVLTAYQAGVHDGGTLLEVAGVAAGGALVKCLLSSFAGQGTPALVEPDPIVRILAEAPPAKVRPIPPEK